MPGAMPAPSDRRPCSRSSAFRQAAIFVCTLLIASGALELHNLANHHRAIEVGGLFDPAASHPRVPHHFDRSEERREPACATCALQAQGRAVRPDPAEALAPAGFLHFEPPAEAQPALVAYPSSASPRGPPTA